MVYIAISKEKMKNLIVDIDGCICRYDFPKLLNKYFGVAIPNSGIFTYSLEDSLGVPPKMVEDMFAAEVYNEPNMIPGARSALKGFISRGYDVLILSNRLHWMTVDELGDWLDTWCILYTDVIGDGELPSYVHAHIDDSPHKLLCVDEKTKVKHRILFTCPWNEQCLDILGKFERADNWKEVRRLVNHAS